jgi:23S rRNA (pseudouridine1915-N3)-methyltransferase
LAGLHIDIIAVGKLKERFWEDACAEYLKRLGRYAKVAVNEVPDKSTKTEGNAEAVLKSEAQAIRQKHSADSYLIALDSTGEQLTSEEFALLITKLQNESVGKLTFLVGGSHGIEEGLKREADFLLSFGAITLPHNLARVVLLEQLYRSFRIINGEPYHK